MLFPWEVRQLWHSVFQPTWRTRWWNFIASCWEPDSVAASCPAKSWTWTRPRWDSSCQPQEHWSSLVTEQCRSYPAEVINRVSHLAVKANDDKLPPNVIFKGVRQLRIEVPRRMQVSVHKKAWMDEGLFFFSYYFWVLTRTAITIFPKDW